MADPDLELRGEGGGGAVFWSLARPAFLPSAILGKKISIPSQSSPNREDINALNFHSM